MTKQLAGDNIGIATTPAHNGSTKDHRIPTFQVTEPTHHRNHSDRISSMLSSVADKTSHMNLSDSAQITPIGALCGLITKSRKAKDTTQKPFILL